MSHDLMVQNSNVNNVPIQSIVDTGAEVSVINAELVRSNKWKITQSSSNLVGPQGELLTSLGTIVAKIELSIG